MTNETLRSHTMTNEVADNGSQLTAENHSVFLNGG